jgi:hypothetical protein
MSCRDYSFGLVPFDIQISNAKVNQTLSACKVVSNDIINSIPITSVQTTAVGNYGAGPLSVEWNLPLEVNPPTFQTSPSTFVIPESGTYQVAVTLSIVEKQGVGTDTLIAVNVNGVDKFALAFTEMPANEPRMVSGSVTVPFVVGDTLAVTVRQVFGSSPWIEYNGLIADLNLSRLAIIKINN